MKITVVSATNEYDLAPLAVLIASAMDQASPEDSYEWMVLHLEDFSEGEKRLRQMCQAWPALTLRLIKCSDRVDVDRLFVGNRYDFAPEAYLRLLIPELLGEEYDKALYLDCDMVACRNLRELFCQPLEDALLAACRDLTGIGLYYEKDSIRKPWQDQILPGAKPEDYFISGTLLMNLKAMRESFRPGQLMELAMERQWQQHDQDLLNVVCRGRVKYLDACWNTVKESRFYRNLPQGLQEEANEALARPGLYHFAGEAGKPWYDIDERAVSLFYFTALKTPFYRDLIHRIDLGKKEEIQKRWQPKPKGGPAMGLKEKLKKILPPPVNSFNREINRVLASVEEEKQLTLLLMKQLADMQSNPNQSRDMKETAELGLAALALDNSGMGKVLPLSELQFEVSLVGHCNLNCRGCAHFSNLDQEHYTDPAQAERDFARLSELTGAKAKFIRLLGGEPLLHPRVTDFMKSARKHFPDTDLMLVTNGLKLKSMGQDFYAACRDYRVKICITRYPTGVDYPALKKYVEDFGVTCEFYYDEGESPKKKTFNKLTLDLEGRGSARENYLKCYMANSCISLSEGRLYTCEIIPHVRYFNQKFGQKLEVTPEDGVDIYAVSSAQELMAALCKPPAFCRYCNVDGRQTQVPWQRSDQTMGEWTN